MFEVEFDKPISESNVSTSIYRTEFKIKIFPTYVVLSPSELFSVWKTIKIDVVWSHPDVYTDENVNHVERVCALFIIRLY